MGYIDLMTYYKLHFSLMQHHKYSLLDIDSMYPFERDIYVELLRDYLNKLEEENSRGR
jgi:hypothetical protein